MPLWPAGPSRWPMVSRSRPTGPLISLGCNWRLLQDGAGGVKGFCWIRPGDGDGDGDRTIFALMWFLCLSGRPSYLCSGVGMAFLLLLQ